MDMMEAAALLLAIAGCGAPPSRARALALHASGWILLGLSFAACVLASSWTMGPVLWLGLLTVAALATALTLTYGPGLIPWPLCLRRLFLGHRSLLWPWKKRQP